MIASLAKNEVACPSLLGNEITSIETHTCEAKKAAAAAINTDVARRHKKRYSIIVPTTLFFHAQLLFPHHLPIIKKALKATTLTHFVSHSHSLGLFVCLCVCTCLY